VTNSAPIDRPFQFELPLSKLGTVRICSASARTYQARRRFVAISCSACDKCPVDACQFPRLRPGMDDLFTGSTREQPPSLGHTAIAFRIRTIAGRAWLAAASVETPPTALAIRGGRSGGRRDRRSSEASIATRARSATGSAGLLGSRTRDGDRQALRTMGSVVIASVR
jgi:hypothetical protein